MTQSDDRQYGAAWSPDGKWIVYQQDHAGNELWDLYAIPSDGGEAINLTNTPAFASRTRTGLTTAAQLPSAYKTKDGVSYDIALLDWSTRKVQQADQRAAARLLVEHGGVEQLTIRPSMPTA